MKLKYFSKPNNGNRFLFSAKEIKTFFAECELDIWCGISSKWRIFPNEDGYSKLKDVKGEVLAMLRLTPTSSHYLCLYQFSGPAIVPERLLNDIRSFFDAYYRDAAPLRKHTALLVMREGEVIKTASFFWSPKK